MSTIVAQRSDRHASDPTVVEIYWSLASASWLSWGRLLAIVVDILPTIRDDLVEQLALGVAERDEEMNGVRALLSAVRDDRHRMHKEDTRLRRRLAEARSRERKAV